MYVPILTNQSMSLWGAVLCVRGFRRYPTGRVQCIVVADDIV
jgi:hypothetical protein